MRNEQVRSTTNIMVGRNVNWRFQIQDQTKNEPFDIFQIQRFFVSFVFLSTCASRLGWNLVFRCARVGWQKQAEVTITWPQPSGFFLFLLSFHHHHQHHHLLFWRKFLDKRKINSKLFPKSLPILEETFFSYSGGKLWAKENQLKLFPKMQKSCHILEKIFEQKKNLF